MEEREELRSPTAPAKKIRCRNRPRPGRGRAVLADPDPALASDDDDSSARATPSGAEIVSVDDAAGCAAEDGTRRSTGPASGRDRVGAEPAGQDRTYVRYLTGGAEAGDRSRTSSPSAPTHGNPAAGTAAQGKEPGACSARRPGDATVYFNRRHPAASTSPTPGSTSRSRSTTRVPAGAAARQLGPDRPGRLKQPRAGTPSPTP